MCAYPANLCHILSFIVELFYHTVEARSDLDTLQHSCSSEHERNWRTSVAALSDCTSHSLSNCSTRASGSTNHCMICTSLIPRAIVSHSLNDLHTSGLPSPMSARMNGLMTARRAEPWNGRPMLALPFEVGHRRGRWGRTHGRIQTLAALILTYMRLPVIPNT